MEPEVTRVFVCDTWQGGGLNCWSGIIQFERQTRQTRTGKRQRENLPEIYLRGICTVLEERQLSLVSVYSPNFPIYAGII